jgi:coproporphyrinogen III oxidase
MNIPPIYAKRLHNWFSDLQNRICQELEVIEQESIDLDIYTPYTPGKFSKREWDFQQNGGGKMHVLQEGRVFEKAGVNVSCVWGEFTEEFAKQIPGASENPQFWACGLSLVIHPRNPFVPIVHMNTRHIITTKSWFGGGIDLTPCIPQESDTNFFHKALQNCCDKFNRNYYPKFKTWCDEYFFLPHRNETRGVGGIFYDYHNTGDFEADHVFNQNVGETFLNSYPEIVRRNMAKPWGEAEIAIQMHKRGRYVEFNLIYDRGTSFGLKTGGNTEAILMSLPPTAKWAD